MPEGIDVMIKTDVFTVCVVVLSGTYSHLPNNDAEKP